jgi:signal transduction histidine kinase
MTKKELTKQNKKLTFASETETIEQNLQKIDLEAGVTETLVQQHNNKGKKKSEDGNSASSNGLSRLLSPSKARLQVCLILFLGLATSVAFVAIGISGALEQQNDEFVRSAIDTVNKIRDAFGDYVNAGSLIHYRCRHREFSRVDFRELYEYLVASGLEFKAVQFDPNITHEERPIFEAEAREYYAENYPYIDYVGFKGFNYEGGPLEPRDNQSWYFPIHYQEPIAGNEAAIDLDYHSSESRTRAVLALFEKEAPSLTDRLNLVKKAGEVSRCGDHDGISYGVVLMHPGVPLSAEPDVWPKDFSTIVLCIPDLLKRSTVEQGQSSAVYIHDRSHPSADSVFMGAARVTTYTREEKENDITFLDEIDLEAVSEFKIYQQRDIDVANRVWTVTVVDESGHYDSNILFVTLGGVIILFASIFLAVWVNNNDRKARKYNAMRAQAESEKAALILQNARQATKTERELNDFIAHEVRNPVAAAMAATNFVKLAVNKEVPFPDQESKELAREDVNIIDNALRFVNDLLRNMLDMHRAANKQLQVTMAPTDLLHDILEPVGGMLYRRGSKVKMIVDCPENLYIMTDCLRLKQVVLNLGRNSTKFIEEGFIRLKAEEIDGNIKLYIDDSGTGIPKDKRKRLFAKFQESLDMLSQGTVCILYLLLKKTRMSVLF